MLEHNSPFHLAPYIIIGLLLASIMYMGYRIGGHEWEMRSSRIQRNWTAGENKTLKELNKNYVEALQYYQALLSKAYTLTKDVTLMLKEGTLVIPPVEKGEV